MKTMHKCNETKCSVSESEGSNPDQSGTTSKTVLFRTNSEDGGEEKRVKKGGKQSERGKWKQKWTKEERVVLWECYVRSGGRGCLGYINRVMEMWNGRDVGIRSQASVLSQIKCIEAGGLLSEYEKSEIEQRIEREIKGDGIGPNPAGQDEEGVDFNIYRENPNVESVDEWNVESEEDLVCESGELFINDQHDDSNELRQVFVEVARLDSVVQNGVRKIITGEEEAILLRIREIFSGTETAEIPSLKGRDRREVLKEVCVINSLLHNVDVGEVNVSSVNRLIYAGSYVVCERLGLMKQNKKHIPSKKPWWQRRLEKSIVQWRKDLGRLEEMSKGVKLKGKVVRELENRYRLVERGSRSVVTFLNNKVKAASAKIKSFVDSNLKSRQNALFQNNQTQLYKELGSKEGKSNQTPDKDDARNFWSKIWSEEGVVNYEPSWMSEVENYLSEVEQQEDISITSQDVNTGIGRMSNWKAPGPDGVRGFWFKKFTALRPMLVEALASCLQNGDVPEWMTTGRTVLIQKDPAKGKIAGNYRPITCLPLMWKLLTGIFAGKIYEHLEDSGLLPEEQKGCRKKSRGTKDQLLIDKAVLKEARLKKRCLSMAWVDYRKAYDMVPHLWILKVLNLSKVAGNLEIFMKNSMASWQTNLQCNGENLGEVKIKRGIFQGDSLSPLLFIMVMMPLSILLRKEKFGYEFDRFTKINHLFFMDDLKLYGKNEREVTELMRVVSLYSEDIGMEFGFEKCAMLNIKGGVRVKSEGIRVPSGELIKEVDEGGYKYLGVLQDCRVMNEEMKEIVRNEYLRRVKAVARSKLYARNLMTAINVWAVSIVRYSAGILNWTKMELSQMDVKTRKILTMNGIFHKKGNVDRLYLKRNEGGRGLMSVQDCVRIEENNLERYMKNNMESLIIAASNILYEESVSECESGTVYKERVATERTKRVFNKEMHGRFFRDVEGFASWRMFEWVKSGYVNKSTEGFLFAAQEQALETNWLKARILGDGADPKCRLCKQHIETVAHLASGCGKLAQLEYKKRHDRMGLRVYWELCRRHGIKCSSEKWYEESPESVRVSECGEYEIWWDRSIATPKRLDHNRPDVVVIDKKAKHWTLIDFSVPLDQNVLKKEEEKVLHYTPLAYEVRKLHKVTTSIVPLVVGALGVVTNNLQTNLKSLQIPDVLGSMQVSAVIGTSIILRKVLSGRGKSGA